MHTAAYPFPYVIRYQFPVLASERPLAIGHRGGHDETVMRRWLEDLGATIIDSVLATPEVLATLDPRVLS